LTIWALLAALPLAAQSVEFHRDIRPIFSDRCFACHGPDQASRKSKLRLDVESGARIDLGQGRLATVAGHPEQSELFRRITSDNPAIRMPPSYLGRDKLADREIDLIRRWIEQGARWQNHWSWLPPQPPVLPEVRDGGWARNPIDRFILARLEGEGWPPSPEAGRAALLRRVTLDLTGLPPAPAEVEAYVNDPSPQAYDIVVERLLASPRYAERMAFRWMEAARYSDTNGYQSDGPREMWRWRDWVIDAFHRNLPFDQFTIEQIAGDLVPGASLSQKIATAFHRNHRTSAEGGSIDEELRVEYVADRVETTATVWMGLTLGCARCHDHKYDLLSQKDYYRLFAFFNNVPEKGFVYNFGNEEPYLKAPLPDQQRRLEELDRRIADAERRLARLRPEIAKEQRRWEKRLGHEPRLDWNIEAGLVHHEPLDGDASSPLPMETGPTGQALRFNGQQSVEAGPEVARFDYRDPFTFAAWIKPDSPQGAILSKAEDYFEGQGHALYLIEGKLRLHVIFRWTDLGLRVESATALPPGQWQHVLVSYDGGMKASGVRMYCNGRPLEVKILFDQLIWPLELKAPFRIGAGGGLRFQGLIDDVRVYNRALSPEEAAVVPLLEPVNELARLRPERRSRAESDKLRMCFLEKFAPVWVRRARSELAGLGSDRDQYLKTIPTVMVMSEREGQRPTFLLKRGAYDAPGEPVQPGVPEVIGTWRKEWPRNRLGLARWLVDRSHPLTARVAVNRFWQMLFGAGLVPTVEDFGSQGAWPLHPELLDWLATEFQSSGWDVKRLLRTIVTSNTYRQSSKLTPALWQRDPENRLLARGPRVRLGPEVIRDQALAVSGLLVEKIGGPSVKPYQPAGLWRELQSGKEYERDKGEGLYRRSLYTYWKRTVAPPAMVLFDSPNRETCTVGEARTNTPLQALNLMNDVTYLEAARKLGERMMREGGAGPRDRLRYGYRLVLARPPRLAEEVVAGGLLEQYLTAYRADPKAALEYLRQGESPLDPAMDRAELAAYSGLASLLLNLDETITKE